MWLDSSQLLDKVAIREVPLLSACVMVVDTARDLGVVLDRQLTLDAHVTAVCRSGYYQLSQLWPIAESLSVEAAKSMRLYRAAWTIATQYCTACLTGWWDACNRYRTLLHGARCTTPWPHHTDTATAPLATSMTTCRLQDRRPGFPVLDWSGTWLPGRGLSAHHRHQRSPTSISIHSDLCYMLSIRPTCSATDASRLPVYGCGTRCQSI